LIKSQDLQSLGFGETYDILTPTEHFFVLPIHHANKILYSFITSNIDDSDTFDVYLIGHGEYSKISTILIDNMKTLECAIFLCINHTTQKSTFKNE